MPQSPVEVLVRTKPAVEPEHGPAPLRWRQAQHPLHRGDRGAQTGLAGLVAGIDQRNQTFVILRGAHPGELAPAAVFSR